MAIVTGATPYVRVAKSSRASLRIDHVVATHLEVEVGRFTGRIHQPMSYGAGKVVLAEKLAAEQGFDLGEATFYSDSITDLPLLERVKTPIVVNPDRRLRRIALRRGWEIQVW